MPSLYIKKFPRQTLSKIKKYATQNNRVLEEQILIFLKKQVSLELMKSKAAILHKENFKK